MPITPDEQRLAECRELHAQAAAEYSLLKKEEERGCAEKDKVAPFYWRAWRIEYDPRRPASPERKFTTPV